MCDISNYLVGLEKATFQTNACCKFIPKILLIAF